MPQSSLTACALHIFFWLHQLCWWYNHLLWLEATRTKLPALILSISVVCTSTIFTGKKSLLMFRSLKKQEAGLTRWRSEQCYFGRACRATSSRTDESLAQMKAARGCGVITALSPPNSWLYFRNKRYSRVSWIECRITIVVGTDINGLKLLVWAYWAGIKSQFVGLKRACVAHPQAILFPPSYIVLPCWESEKANSFNFHSFFILVTGSGYTWWRRSSVDKVWKK